MPIIKERKKGRKIFNGNIRPLYIVLDTTIQPTSPPQKKNKK